jgi:hypothetical protein
MGDPGHVWARVATWAMGVISLGSVCHAAYQNRRFRRGLISAVAWRREFLMTGMLCSLFLVNLCSDYPVLQVFFGLVEVAFVVLLFRGRSPDPATGDVTCCKGDTP